MDRLDAKRFQILDALRNPDQWDPSQGLVLRQVMTPAPFCIGLDVSALELVMLLNERGHRHLLVTDETNRLVGVISDRDVGGCFGPGKYPDKETLKRITVGELMSTNVVTIDPDAPLQSAVSLMVEHGISCLPVIVGGGVVGILTDTDLRLVLEILLQTLREPPARIHAEAPAS